MINTSDTTLYKHLSIPNKISIIIIFKFKQKSKITKNIKTKWTLNNKLIIIKKSSINKNGTKSNFYLINYKPPISNSTFYQSNLHNQNYKPINLNKRIQSTIIKVL